MPTAPSPAPTTCRPSPRPAAAFIPELVVAHPTGNTTPPDHAGGTITFTDVDLTDRPTVQFALHLVHLPESRAYRRHFGADGAAVGADRRGSSFAAADAPAGANANNGSASWSYSAADKQFRLRRRRRDAYRLGYDVTVTNDHGASRRPSPSRSPSPAPTTSRSSPAAPRPARPARRSPGRGIPASSEDPDAYGTVTFTDVDLSDTHRR